MRPCGHSAVCRDCTQELMTRSQPCLVCRKEIVGFNVGVYSGNLGKRGLWLTSARNIRELARNDGFNEYFQKQFNGNEATFLRWKEIFDVLEIVGGRGIYYTVRESMEQQVLRITRLEDLMKLRALAKLYSSEFFDDPSLLAVAWRRILEVLELAMPEEKKVRGKKKKKKNDPRKLEILDACFALGLACNNVRDFDDARGYLKRAKEGYEEEYEEVIKVHERCLAGRMTVLGEYHKDTLGTLSNLGAIYTKLENYEKALECFKRAL
ncbi:hypothetical protein TL16_g06186 [Triparma laevis f. inornata]|uniref:Uncharacterized protein n=1 Tax=Triparma laevis f. inornata TaxID=1714386 RepID=A0A9W7AP29_9STRA|nr:hypothetical protein TL16_g06186 [Triparma laevis f. inornata]